MSAGNRIQALCKSSTGSQPLHPTSFLLTPLLTSLCQSALGKVSIDLS